MKDQESAPWVETKKDKTLRVRVSAETVKLLDREELRTRWDYSYFFDSYQNQDGCWPAGGC